MQIVIRKTRLAGLILIIFMLSGCSSNSLYSPSPTGSSSLLQANTQPGNTESPPGRESSSAEVEVQIIPLSGPIADPKAEISGMAWHGDDLFLLPQFPDRFSQSLFKLEKRDILSAILGETTTPLNPEPVQLINADRLKRTKGFEGFESITFQDDQVYLTIEAKPKEMLGYLVYGTISNAQNQITLDSNLIEILPQASIGNYSDESILVFGDKIYTFYEANGVNVNNSPVAHTFSLAGEPVTSIPFPNIEYRITDASSPDLQGRFWMINYFFPLDKIKVDPAADPLADKFGRGLSHAQNLAVERLVAFQITNNGVELLDTPPIQLSLEADMVSRNWEALAILDGYGFLIATDKFPQTLFGFVRWDFTYP